VGVLWRVYEEHPLLVKTPMTTAPSGPNGLVWTEALPRPGSSGPDMAAAATFASSAVWDLAMRGRVTARLLDGTFLGRERTRVNRWEMR
jgi:hypothetical protein